MTGPLDVGDAWYALPGAGLDASTPSLGIRPMKQHKLRISTNAILGARCRNQNAQLRHVPNCNHAIHIRNNRRDQPRSAEKNAQPAGRPLSRLPCGGAKKVPVPGGGVKSDAPETLPWAIPSKNGAIGLPKAPEPRRQVAQRAQKAPTKAHRCSKGQITGVRGPLGGLTAASR